MAGVQEVCAKLRKASHSEPRRAGSCTAERSTADDRHLISDVRPNVIVFHCTANSMESGLAHEKAIVDIIEQADPNAYKLVNSFDTADGARTGLFVAERDELFVAVPRRGSQAAEVRIYHIE